MEENKIDYELANKLLSKMNFTFGLINVILVIGILFWVTGLGVGISILINLLNK